MRVAIHQPNFMPWYPFFQKMASVDVFVILGHCQFEKNNYQNRFHMNGLWNTMSVNAGLQNIVDKTYVNAEHDWKKITKRLYEYKHINTFAQFIYPNLFKTNAQIITYIAKEILQLKTRIIPEFDPLCMDVGTERLVKIVKLMGGDTYVAGTGAVKYMDTGLFSENDIKVEFQKEEEMVKVPILQWLKDNNV